MSRINGLGLLRTLSSIDGNVRYTQARAVKRDERHGSARSSLPGLPYGVVLAEYKQ